MRIAPRGRGFARRFGGKHVKIIPWHKAAAHVPRCCMVDGVGHNLKNEADPERTERINRQIAALCE